LNKTSIRDYYKSEISKIIEIEWTKKKEENNFNF
jgi:hypothetical protein